MFRNVVRMQLKHIWSQKPASASIYVPLPTNIAHRLEEEGGEYAWPALMHEVEAVGQHLHVFASTVVMANKNMLSVAERARAVMRWCSQVEIDMIGKIIAVGKVLRMVHEQEADLRNLLCRIYGQ